MGCVITAAVLLILILTVPAFGAILIGGTSVAFALVGEIWWFLALVALLGLIKGLSK